MSYSKLYNYDDFLSFLSGSGYDEASKKQKEALEKELEGKISAIQREKDTINKDYDELARQAYVSYMATSRDLSKDINKAGFNGGAADNLYSSLVNEYNNNYNEIGKERIDKLNMKDGEISDARAESSNDYSKYLSDLYSSAVDNFLDGREAEEKRNFDSYYKDKDIEQQIADREAEIKINNAKLQFDKDKNQRDYLLEKAKLAFQTGDSSLLKELGINPSIFQGGSSSGSGANSLTGASLAALGVSNVFGGSVDSADLLKTLEYAVELAKYGNFSLFCRITGMTEEEAALEFADKTSKYSEAEIKDAAMLFMGGDYSANVLKVLKSAYPHYNYSQIYKLWEDIATYDWLMDLPGAYQGPEREMYS